MSWRQQLQEIQRERQERMRRDLQLRIDLKWQLANVLMLAQIADQVFSLAGRLFGGRCRRRAHRS